MLFITRPTQHMDIGATSVPLYNRKTLKELRNNPNNTINDDLRQKLRDLCVIREPGLQTSASPAEDGRRRGNRKRCARKQKRGKRAGANARLKANPRPPALRSLLEEREAATNSDFINLEEFTSTVTSYIGKCINDVSISKIITTHSNQKPWTTAKHLIKKLSLLGLNTSLFNWILDFLTERAQSVRIGNSISSTTTLSTGAPQGCVLSPLLFTLLTHDCAPTHSSNHIIKFADDMTVVGLISKNDESAYREEVQRLPAWCGANNLSLNVDKTKEMVVDFRRTQNDHSPLIIDGSSVEIIKRTKFLGVHLADNLTWSLNTSSITKKAQQRLYFLRSLRKAHLPPPILFYRGTIESIVSSCITAWFGNCTVSDRKTLQRIVRTAEIIGVSLPSIMDIYTTCCIRKAHSIVEDHTHPSHTYFTLLPSGKRFQSILAVTSRLCNSFFPQAIRLLNRHLN
ncbi:gastrula zinc finger protein XlCGF28.1-like [Silurus asotus]|uniref:Gastrula zinc finger protein XlCGF28.1-like n=1 Tax=Silurus asotus TaxID=30991 RepID=A0AAD5AQ91_SILAS|nr:gastrula zinc finger protein XlCGF28.1-like [Silurus asotus]